MASFDLDFVCVGPQRTGTTWVYEMLRQHPDLCLPKAVKETMYFDQHYEQGLEWYSQYFGHARPGQLHGEVAPTYFDAPKVPQRILDVSPDCRILITLRDPVERARSLFLHHLKKGRVSRNFWDAAERVPRIIEAGRYARYIPRWRSRFGSEQVTLLFLDDIKKKPKEVLRLIQATLGVRRADPPENQNERFNGASLPRFTTLARGIAFLTTKLHEYGFHNVVRSVKKTGAKSLVYSGGEERMPTLSASVRENLVNEYERDIRFVEEESGRDLSRWRAQPEC